MNKSKICIHPWSQLNVNPNGDVWPCCHQRSDSIYVLGNYKHQSIDEIYNNQPLKDLRRKMLQGILPKEACAKCIEYENLNIKSPRQVAELQPYAKSVHELISKTNADGSVDDYKIKYWDLRWSNKCNETAEGKVWLQCNNWYTKSTKTDEKAGRQRSRLMWMESYETYLRHLIGGEEGARNEHLRFS